MPTNLTKTNHIPAIYMRICFLLFLSLISKSLAAQDLENPKPWGLHFGYSTQQTIPFNLPDYHYTQVHILGQIPIKKYMYKKINLHFFVEGATTMRGISFSIHGLPQQRNSIIFQMIFSKK